MRQTIRVFLVAVVVCALTSGIGCGSKVKTGNAADTRSPGQYFKEQQSSTMTPNGKIVTESVKEQDGTIEYKTEDGKKWRVTHSKRTDGTYQYGTPEELK